MSIMPWFRMYSEFATDPKVQMLSEADQRRYIMLLCLRCSNGDVTLHDDEIAFQLRISNEEWSLTKAVLVSKGLIDDESSPAAWDKRQYVSDSSAARVRAHRERKKTAVKQKCNVTVTPPDTDTDTDTEVRASEAPAPKTTVAVQEYENNTVSIDQRQKIPMDLDWNPDMKSLSVICRKSGVDIGLITTDMITRFKLWYTGKQSRETNNGWTTKLVSWAIDDRAKAHEKAKSTASAQSDPNDISWIYEAGSGL